MHNYLHRYIARDQAIAKYKNEIKEKTDAMIKQGIRPKEAKKRIKRSITQAIREKINFG